MKRLFIALFLLIGIGYSSNNVYYTDTYCLNETTSRYHVTTYNGTANYSKGFFDTQCSFGCDENYGTCFEAGVFTFELGFMIALMFMSFISLHAVKVLKEQGFEKDIGGFHFFGSGLKILFFALSLMFQVFIFMRIGSLQDTLKNSIINDIGSVAVSISQILFWLVFIILFFMFIFYFMDFMGSLSQKKLEKQKEKDEEYD